MTGETMPPMRAIAGRFDVLAVLGQGAHAAVYRVRDRRSGEVLALKRLRITPAPGDAAASRFEREYYTLAELAHPHIIRVHDYGLDSGGPYYTMELLDGADLRRLGKQPWRRAAALLRDVAASLAVLHSRRLLHRDVSPRNVRSTEGGRAKLLDFGSMTPMGTPRNVAGTAPYVPPEALQQQSLDARADLYALGALGYFLLTGKNAYPARSLADLRDTWRSAPAPPDRHEPEVPAALSALVMQLLLLDRSGRPARASEVIERLETIAELPPDDSPALTRAYLTMPAMVGRHRELLLVREQLLDSLVDKGAVILVEGAPGVGRSRFLDACVLEAKLLGSVVLRADSGDAGRGEHGATRALIEQALHEMGDVVDSTPHEHRALLATLNPALGSKEVHTPPAPTRSELLNALQRWFAAMADRGRLAIAIDDMEHLDEPSQALIGALADVGPRHGMSLFVTCQAGAETQALGLVRNAATGVQLACLSSDQTEQLVRSLFGDVDNVVAVARRIHELSLGTPRDTMTLAEHLVATEQARHAGGDWILPGELEDLPPSLEDALRATLDRLDADARELAEALALSEPPSLKPDGYPELTGHRDHGRTFRALDGLLASGVLIASGDRFDFSRRPFQGLLEGSVPAHRAKVLHARLARLADPEDPVLVAGHLLEADQQAAAIELLLAHRTDPAVEHSPRTVALLERVCEGASGMQRAELEVWLCAASALLGDVEHFQKHAPPLLARLVEHCREDAHDRALFEVLDRRAALEQLVRLCAASAAMGALSFDTRLLARLPALSPWREASPAVALVEDLIDGVRALNAGRQSRAHVALERLLATAQGETGAKLDSLYRKSLTQGVSYLIGLIEAGWGLPTAADRVTDLMEEPGRRGAAWQLRRIVHLMQADPDDAIEARRRAELLQLADGPHREFPEAGLRVEATAHWLASDLLGLRQVTPRLEEASLRYPAWSHLATIARAHRSRLSGDAEGSARDLEALLGELRPGEHLDWTHAAAAHLEALVAAGELGRAVEAGRRYLSDCAEHELTPAERIVGAPLAVALALHGELAEAEALAERLVSEAHDAGVRGMQLGLLLEARARVALAARDAAELEHYAQRCARAYNRDEHRALGARFAHLVRDAIGAGMLLPRPAVWNAGRRAALSLPAVERELKACATREDRGAAALAALMQHAGANGGVLYGVEGRELSLLAVAPEPSPPEGLLLEMSRVVADEQRRVEGRREQGGIDVSVTAMTESVVSEVWMDEQGHSYVCVPLVARDVTAAVALTSAEEWQPFPARELLDALAPLLSD